MKRPFTCAVCEAPIPGVAYAYGGKHYCSSACYDTLFTRCDGCGERNMQCQRNAAPNARNPSWGGPENHLCDPCHAKKHRWGIMTIVAKF